MAMNLLHKATGFQNAAETMTKPYVPHESAPHAAIWTAWPSHEDLWEENLSPARAEVAGMIRALADVDPTTDFARGEVIRVLACGDEARESARNAAGDIADVLAAEFGDIWLRDIGPVFAADGGAQIALRPRFNGWGGKYDLPGDTSVSAFVANAAGVALRDVPLTLEGGALEFDGEGMVLTTRECLLNPNRNPGLTEAEAERILKEFFGLAKVLWLDRGLINDHTDGHIDNVARFLGRGRVACQAPSGVDDPHAERLHEAAAALRAMTDAEGRRLDVVEIPSPGRVENEDGEAMPASHMNYVIGNRAVVVPTYGTPSAEAAVAAISLLFPERKVVGLPATAILSGGGAFHCITQHQPLEVRS
jgi:agmatine deiminase